MMKNNNKRFRLKGKIGYYRESGDIPPKQVIFMSVEGAKTEYSYFYNLGECLKRVQEAPIIKVEVLARRDNNSDPEHVLDLLQEYLALLHEGLIPTEIKDDFLKAGITDDDVERYIEDTSSLDSDKKTLLEKKISDYELDFKYRSHLRDYGQHDNDRYVVVVDRDYKSHTVKAFQNCVAFIQKSDMPIELYLSNPSFDLWLLLHSKAGCEYLSKADKNVIKENAKVSSRHTELSNQVAEIFHHRKSISFGKFQALYWNNIFFAIESSKEYNHNIDYLINDIGTNIAEFFSDDIKMMLPHS